MVDLVLQGGTIYPMTSNGDRIADGAVAIADGRIYDVGTVEDISDRYDPDRTIVADDHVILPGFISAHVHVVDILLRGLGNNRSLYDWLLNVKKPGAHAMTTRDNEIASALYCLEAIQSGITTFVENAIGAGGGYDDETIETKLDVYDIAGIRNVFGHPFRDRDTDDTSFSRYIRDVKGSRPSVSHPPAVIRETDEALSEIRSLIERYHDPDERQSVWPAPTLARDLSPKGLRGAVEIAEEYDVMTTTHAAETHHSTDRGYDSTIEYLETAGYLGDRTLLGHCVQVDERDVARLAATDTRIAHNPLTNLVLGAGVAPIPTMLNYGVTVGIGTDNPSVNNTVNAVNDARFAALVHNGHRQDPTAMTAERVVSMLTIDGARAIGRADDLGSIEPGKRADLVTIDLDYPHLTPHPDELAAIVYQAQGFEVDHVICDGSVVMEHRRVDGIEEAFPDLRSESIRRSERIAKDAGLVEE